MENKRLVIVLTGSKIKTIQIKLPDNWSRKATDAFVDIISEKHKENPFHNRVGIIKY